MRQLTHLPEPLTSLVGREPDVRRLTDLLSRPTTRHLTLCGPGGIGKTRLALRVGQSVGHDFPDGVSFIDLSAVTDPTLVASTIAGGLGLALTGPEPAAETLIAHLADRAVLLILDNFEHLLPAATLVPTLAAACPDLAVLVTSRERLGTTGEQVVGVEPLALPNQTAHATAVQVLSSPAVQLFVERAAAARPEFALTDENAAAVATICRRVDGMPLAIELAAARVAHLSPAAIATNFERLLPLLEGGAPDQPSRLRTMSDAVRWSYDLLEPAEQALFRRLAVFAGGCTIEAATAVCITPFTPANEQPLDGQAADISTILRLASLVDKSLLRFNDRDGAESRYTMLEPVREFGLTQLAAMNEETTTRRAHAGYFLALAQRLRPELRGKNPGPAIRTIDAETADFRAALQWLLHSEQTNPVIGLELCNKLAAFWVLQGRSAEGKFWLYQFVQRVGDSISEEIAAAYLHLGHLEQSNADDAFRYYQRSLTLYRQLNHVRGAAGLLSCLGMAAEEMGKYAEAREYLAESLGLFEQIEDLNGIAHASYQLGILVGEERGFEQARAFLDNARGFYEQLEDLRMVAFTIIEIGRLYRLQGRLDEATDLLAWSLARFTESGVAYGHGPAHYELGEVALLRGDLSLAIQEFSNALVLHREANTVDRGMSRAVDGLARTFLLQQQPELAVQTLAAVDAWEREAGFKATPEEASARSEALRIARRHLGRDRFEVTWDRGRRTALNSAADLVLSHKPLAAVSTVVTPVRAIPEVEKLTKQEQRVLCLIANGLSNQQIADSLSITVRTAANHVTNILGKFAVDNRTHAAAIAMRNNICPQLGPVSQAS